MDVGEQVSQSYLQGFGNSLEGIHRDVLPARLDPIDEHCGKLRFLRQFFLT